MPSRVCLNCGRVFNPGAPGASKSRCLDCTRTRNRDTTRAKRAVRPYTAAERERRAATVRAHRAQHGDWCPGWQVPPHASADLTADHVVSFAVSRIEHSPLSVLCRSCNSRKRASK